MRRVFADSFYFFALTNTKDTAHRRAMDFSAAFDGELITTPWVLTEVGDGLARPSLRSLFIELLDDLKSNAHVYVDSCSDELLTAGIDLFGRRMDKEWSLTDCISFVVMWREGITEALTGDHHFEQAGFVGLLK
jgi:uncharacterized protein